MVLFCFKFNYIYMFSVHPFHIQKDFIFSQMMPPGQEQCVLLEYHSPPERLQKEKDKNKITPCSHMVLPCTYLDDRGHVIGHFCKQLLGWMLNRQKK